VTIETQNGTSHQHRALKGFPPADGRPTVSRHFFWSASGPNNAPANAPSGAWAAVFGSFRPTVLVLTMPHVVEKSDRVFVGPQEMDVGWRARWWASIRWTDLALVRLMEPGPCRLATLAIPTPQVRGIGRLLSATRSGLDNTVTMGIISNLSRNVPANAGDHRQASLNLFRPMRRSTQAIPGGPLPMPMERWLGLHVWCAQARELGLGSAIPINRARSHCHQMLATGSVSHPMIGVGS